MQFGRITRAVIWLILVGFAGPVLAQLANGTAIISTASLANPLWGHGVTGSAVPANATMAGFRASGNLTVPIICDNWTPFSIANTTATKLVSKVSAKTVYICSVTIANNAATNVALIAGTKVTTECDTSTAGLSGGTTAATGWNFSANSGLTQGIGIGVIMATASTNIDVCIVQSASTQISGGISWTQF